MPRMGTARTGRPHGRSDGGTQQDLWGVPARQTTIPAVLQ